MKIPMLDLKSQYLKIKEEVDSSIQEVIDSSSFINGPAVQRFEKNLASYLESEEVIACANGTDALQVAMMALGLERGDEVIVPAFTYAATAEVVGLLGLVPVMVDVDESTFNIKIEDIEPSISDRTRAIVPVHLFGQSAQMEQLMEIAKRRELFVIEDNAQALGAKFRYSNGEERAVGTIGDIGCTSFFPTKNLGCYGDGGAIFTQSREVAERVRMVTDHGQKIKYYHDIIGCNSRLDSIQAAILDVKLKELDNYSNSRYRAAQLYKELLIEVEELELPIESPFSTHVYHQFTLKVLKGDRDRLKSFLAERGVASMTYYPLSLNNQKAFSSISKTRVSLENSERLASQVLSLPMHSELSERDQIIICNAIKEFYNEKR